MFFTQTLEKKMLCAYTHTQITTINRSKKTPENDVAGSKTGERNSSYFVSIFVMKFLQMNKLFLKVPLRSSCIPWLHTACTECKTTSPCLPGFVKGLNKVLNDRGERAAKSPRLRSRESSGMKRCWNKRTEPC